MTESKPTAYLAGPMTGHTGYNYPAFDLAAAMIEKDGRFQPHNPADNFGGATSLSREQYLRMAIPQVLACDVLILLHGWRESQGAVTEAMVAFNCGKIVFELEYPTYGTRPIKLALIWKLNVSSSALFTGGGL
jgi:hypothetical protein